LFAAARLVRAVGVVFASAADPALPAAGVRVAGFFAAAAAPAAGV
jgi:hypothetical protein